MPEYFYNNQPLPEWQLLEAVEEEGLTLEEFLEQNPGVTTGGVKSEEVETEETEGIILPTDIEHPTVESFKEVIKGPKGYLQREGQIKKLLDEHYGNTDLSEMVKFREVEAGRDAIEVLIGDQKPGEGAQFDFYGGISGDTRLSWGAGGRHAGGVRKHTDDEQMFQSLVQHVKYELNPEKKKQDFQQR